MFNPGGLPAGVTDRRAMGQRIMAELVPRLLSFRFQGGRPNTPAPGLAKPQMPGAMPARQPLGAMPLRPQMMRPSNPTMQPRPAMSAPPRPGGAGLTSALGAPAPQPLGASPTTSKMQAEAGGGQDIMSFIALLNLLSGRGGDAPGSGDRSRDVAAAAGSAGLGGDRGFASV